MNLKTDPLAAIAESDEAFARCARCDRPERAPGNAAALREALERAIDAIEALIALYDEELRALENAHGIFSEYPDKPALAAAAALAWLFGTAKDSAQ